MTLATDYLGLDALLSTGELAWRDTVRTFVRDRIRPNITAWYESAVFPVEIVPEMGRLGLLGAHLSGYGCPGRSAVEYGLAALELEAGDSGLRTFVSVQGSLAMSAIHKFGTEAQKERWLPSFISGDMMFAIAMTEPGTGSDLAGMRTTAKLSADGSHYVLNGAKTFITGGVHADRVIVCARTAPQKEDDRRYGISLLVVDTKLEGYSVGRKLDKLGLRVSDTAELAFDDVKVPAEDLLGEENKGFSYLGQNLPQERLAIAYGAYAQAAAAVEFAKRYTQERHVFGKAVASFQNTKFELAACKAEVDAAQAVADRALEAHDAGELTAAEAASAKLFCTEVASRVIDRCLQLHGGYGYINEYPIARLYADNRVNRIYGGTSEVMKTIIAKDMGL